MFADTDAARWRVDRGLFAGDGFHSRGVLDEVDRYRDLLANGSIPALASVLVAGVALLAWIVATIARRTSNGSATDATPLVFGGILLAAVMLLTLTPSKWTYHFGSLSAFAALAIAAESSRVATMRGRRGAIVGVPVVVALVLVELTIVKLVMVLVALLTRIPPLKVARPETVKPERVPTEVKEEAVTPEASVLPVRVPAAAAGVVVAIT